MALIELALSTIAPPECLVCLRQGVGLCDACADDLADPIPERCFRCYSLSPGARVCSNCRWSTGLQYVWVVSEYKSGIQKAVHSLKFGRNRGLGRPLAKLLSRQLPFFPVAPVVTHTPTVTSHVRARGFDHAELLAKELSKLHPLPYVPLLRRIGQSRQVGARRQTRVEQLQGAFRPIRASLVQNRHILLVDDVTTTGATLVSAALTLKRAGAKSVSAVVLAQKS